MPALIELQRTGFFREMPHGEPGDPRLAEARQVAPAHYEDRVVRYLEAGQVYIATPGLVPDVFAPGAQIGPPHYLTNGRFVWPGDLAHYVRTYHVRLDGRFLEHMLASGWTVPAEIDLATLALPSAAGAPGGAPGDPAASARPPDLGSAVADLIGALSGAAGADAAAIKQSLDEASAGAARAAQTFGQEIRTTLGAAGATLGAQLSASLRGLNEWLEKPDSEKTEQLQAMMASLEARLDRALAPERLAEQAERAQRLSQQIRQTIAARLRQHGLEPTEPAAPAGAGTPAQPAESAAPAQAGAADSPVAPAEPGTPTKPATPDDKDGA